MKLICKKCGYQWESRKENVSEIRECPQCKSRYWNRDKKATK
jgi:predicted Zn-ribbon and HTH transcriptional regulator